VSARELLIFARTPEFGKVKTRLAADIGPESALRIYTRLLTHTCETALRSGFPARVYLAGPMPERDLWSDAGFHRFPQADGDLGQRMSAAFAQAFADGVRSVVIIGTDCPGLTSAHLHEAMSALQTHEAVVGPADDGGYTLLGLTSPIRAIFENKAWSTDTVLGDTLADFKRLGMSVARLETLRDLDTLDDLNALTDDHPWLQD
jgi:rSAM/selenodomain-associated transferase 1